MSSSNTKPDPKEKRPESLDIWYKNDPKTESGIWKVMTLKVILSGKVA